MEHLTRRTALLGLGLATFSAGMGATAATAAPAAAVTLTPSSGPPGSSVVLSGSGFPRSSAGAITGGVTPVSFQTSKAGTFSAQATIAATAQGTAPLTATSGKTSRTATFTVFTGVPPVSAAFLRFGVATPGGAAANAELDAVAALVGESPAIVLSYKDFRQAPPLAELDSVVGRGAVPLLTWEPWIAGYGVAQPAFGLARMSAGVFDA
jgi:hypothetical protein